MRSQSPRAHEATNIPPRLHELEAEVMEEVWLRGRASVREVMQAVNAGAPRQRAYTTYMTVMSRLEVKGMLERSREGKTDFYRPLFIRSEYNELRARAEVDSIVDEFGEVALAHIARQMAQLDPQRRRVLRRLARGK
jgi:predicted transcriptional regulator